MLAPASSIYLFPAAHLLPESLFIGRCRPYRHRVLGDPWFEPVAVDRSVQHHRRHDAGHEQASYERGGLAMALPETHPQPLAFRAAAVTPRHLRGGASFVDKDEALGLEIDLAIERMLALGRGVGTVLLNRVPGLLCA